jgi:hypothetical protein
VNLWLQKKVWKKNFSPLSFVAVFGFGIRDKHPGSATLLSLNRRSGVIFLALDTPFGRKKISSSSLVTYYLFWKALRKAMLQLYYEPVQLVFFFCLAFFWAASGINHSDSTLNFTSLLNSVPDPVSFKASRITGTVFVRINNNNKKLEKPLALQFCFS